MKTGYSIEWMFTQLDTILVETAAHNIALIAKTITPLVSVGLAIGFIWYGMAVLRGAIEEPLLDLLGRVLKISVITSIALVGGLYQTEFSQIIIELPDDISRFLFSGGNDLLPQLTDMMMNRSSRVATLITSSGSILTPIKTYLLAILGFVFVFSAALFSAVISISLIMIKVSMTLLVAVGPIFILALLFDSTKDLFARWLSQVFNFIILTILTTVMCRVTLILQDKVLGAVQVEVEQGLIAILQICGSFFLISIICIILILMLPNLANSLAGGFSVTFAPAIRGARSVLKI